MKLGTTAALFATTLFLAAGCGGGGGGSTSALALPPFSGASMSWSAPAVLDGPAAYKTKLLRVTWNDAGTFRTILVSIFGNGIGNDVWDFRGDTHPARDIFVTRSLDFGTTWTPPKNISETALLTSATADHDGDPLTPPLAYAGDSGKPTVFSNGKNVCIIWEDAYAPGGAQRTVRYPEHDNREVPYRAIYIARSRNAGDTWDVQVMTDASRDAKQSVLRGTSAGWVATWQEDPEGLQPGDAEGPGDGGSGAKVSHETDIWYTRLAAADYGSGAPWPAPVRLTNNLGDNVGASRCNQYLFGSALLIAYEETKGDEVLFGKYVRYHVFSNFLDPATDPTGGAGWIISNPDENARRVRIMGQGGAGPTTGLRFMFIWKQGEYDEGGPSDILTRAGYADPAGSGPTNGLMPTALLPAINPQALDYLGALGNTQATNLSSALGLGATTGADFFEDARAHRGVLRGDFVFMGYAYTPDWAVARYTNLENYNFFIRRSFDGGATWTAPFNISMITDKGINVREPRIVGTPGSSDPNDPQAKKVFFVAWGSEINQYEHASVGTLDLDIYITRTLDQGESFAPVFAFAAGPNAQSESQIRCPPDGNMVWTVWNEQDPAGNVFAMYRGASAP